MANNLLKVLKNPPNEYRPIPFWSWNEKLDIDETRRQIDEMEKAGIGGYFMHARGGLQTPYMQKDWMDNIKAALEEGDLRSMGAWGYDENGWPSGFGDGTVNGAGERFQQKYLRVERVPEPECGPKTIANIEFDGCFLHFYYEVNQFYVDTLDPEVTKLFLNNIHEKYKEELGDDFKKMTGFFTDEPQISRNGIPWSFILPDEYRRVYGEDILPLLPDLFFETDTSNITRYRFWRLVRDLFADNFMKQIYDWCEANGTLLTGHMVLEETLLFQVTSNSACMPCYEFFHIPGIDWLCRFIDPSTTPVQAASVAHQLGKKQILSETFALCGWDVSFEEMKWIYEWQMVRGVNLLCQHLEGYSLRGIRKRDYPASLFYQQPWWSEYRLFNDLASRIGMLLAEGEVRCEVLLLHAQSSAWLCYNNSDNGRIHELYERMVGIATMLEDHQIPYHYGDERIIQRYGSVKGDRFVVGTQDYSVVIVPPMLTMASETYELLLAFKQNGGLILWCEEAPTMLDGEITDRIDRLVSEHGIVAADKLITHIPDSVKKISLLINGDKVARGIAAAVRYFPDFTMYYFVNSKAGECDAKITVDGKSCELFNYVDSSLEQVDFTSNNDSITIRHHFYGMDSLILFVYYDERALPKAPKEKSEPIPELFDGEWSIVKCDENALVLDYCEYSIDGVNYGITHINNIQEIACSYKRRINLELKFQFEIRDMPEGRLFLVLERPDRFEIYINDIKVDNRTTGYYHDKSFERVDITGAVSIGNNEIVLKTEFKQSPKVYQAIENSLVFESERNKLTYDDEIEAIYIVGEFGVATEGSFEQMPRRAVLYDGSFAITKRPDKVVKGSFVHQGFPFFSGRMTIRKSFTAGSSELKGRCIRFDDRCSSVVKVRVNGKDAGTIMWKPYEVSLEGMLKEGDNEVEIEIIGNLRNLLGPHHLATGESYIVGPSCFFENSKIWCGGKNPDWTNKYCFVKYGV